ncbi:MAG: MBL fold metallo-hydrolase, partial [Planctomycetota bacterium]
NERPEEPGRGHVPGLPGWTWLHTPGHTAGHVSLFREYDKLLLSGDALSTVNLDSWQAMLHRRRELSRPATPFTPDWSAAQMSVRQLAELEPKTIAAGHGLPLWGRYVSGELHGLAEYMPKPKAGRYTDAPVLYDRTGGVSDVPPAANDPVISTIAVAAGLAVAGIGLMLVASLKRR